MATLLVANTGGHLKQLHELRPRLQVDDDVIWATFDTPQSRSLLAGERVLYVRPTGTRDVRHVLTNSLVATGLLARLQIDRVISTGAAVALAFLPVARALGIPATYIESATRTTGPSTTGRLLARVPGVALYTQHTLWADERWQYAGSVFDGYTSSFKRFPPQQLGRVVVTLGQHDYGFRRLVERLVAILPAEADVLWQTGRTDVSGLGIDARASVPGDELRAAIATADVVVSHAGIGSILGALEARRCPVIVPRCVEHGEHVDDHQLDIADALRGTDIAVARECEELTLADLLFAASLKVRRDEALPPVPVDGTAAAPVLAGRTPPVPAPAPSATIA
jgi:UDP-N-acetylglucosamine--N-acetylmuramyl-(pentapeptide) pyrophosphoryl-undecaprenol N-acetylglucosamine transferase